MSHVYKICTRNLWIQSSVKGSLLWTDHDIKDGFIHLSAKHQLLNTLKKHYAGVGDLCILTIEIRNLKIKWETSRGGELFPHLYGGLPICCVTRVDYLTLGIGGEQNLPPDFYGLDPD